MQLEEEEDSDWNQIDSVFKYVLLYLHREPSHPVLEILHASKVPAVPLGCFYATNKSLCWSVLANFPPRWSYRRKLENQHSSPQVGS